MVSDHYTHPDPAVRELIARHVRAALNEAADEVHRESRWALETFMRGGDYDAVDRLLMVERIVRNLTPP